MYFTDFTHKRTRDRLRKHGLLKVHKLELYEEYLQYVHTFYTTKVNITLLKRYNLISETRISTSHNIYCNYIQH